jgi:hypothetical protein
MLLAATGEPGKADQPKSIRVGMIGLDTSHVDAFAKALNGPKPAEDLAGLRVVAAYPGGSQDLPLSRDRLAGFTKTLKDREGVDIVDSIETLLTKVDVVMLESVDGRLHLNQLRPVLKAGKPVFIDKPIACSLPDALRIFNLARTHKVPVFSSSSFRFAPQIVNLRKDGKLGDVVGAVVYGPCPLQTPQFPDLFWYGVHGCEALFTVMGPGCETVTRTKTETADVVTGVWKDGRVGTFRGLRGGKTEYGLVAFGSKAVVTEKLGGDYGPLLSTMAGFFRSGKPPVSADETIELFTFLEAAHESTRQGGIPIKLADILAKARAEINKP